jgi:hypothetical protein
MIDFQPAVLPANWYGTAWPELLRRMQVIKEGYGGDYIQLRAFSHLL